MRLGIDVVAQLVADYESGLSVLELQMRFGLSRGSILRLLHEAEVQLRRQPLMQKQLAKIIELYEVGLSIREVAAKLGIPKTTVQNALARSAVVMRPAVRQRRI
jgi:transposase